MNKVKTLGTHPLILITIMGDSGGFKDKQPEIKVRLFQNSLTCVGLFKTFSKIDNLGLVFYFVRYFPPISEAFKNVSKN